MKKNFPIIQLSRLKYETISPASEGKVRHWFLEAQSKRVWFKRWRKEFLFIFVLLFAFLPRPAHIKAQGVEPPYIKSVPRLEPVLATQFIVPEEVVVQPEPQPVAPVAATPVAPPVASAPVSGSHTDWMAAAGISGSDYGYVDYIVSHESTWNYLAVNSIGATGLCQSLPGNKMATAGADWATNPVTQLRWCSSYAAAKGGWYASYVFWQNNHWW